MKGTIAKCLQEMVVDNFGQDKWEKVLTNAGMNAGTKFLTIADVDDAAVINVFQSAQKTLGITWSQACDAFGDYWVNVYSVKLYNHYLTKYDNAKDFIMGMDKLHVSVTNSMANARPPRFDFEWTDDKTLIMHYKSERNLIDLLVGLAKGVGKYFKENLKVTKLDEKRMQIVFS